MSKHKGYQAEITENTDVPKGHWKRWWADISWMGDPVKAVTGHTEDEAISKAREWVKAQENRKVVNL